jgi:hypothetical protein
MAASFQAVRLLLSEYAIALQILILLTLTLQLSCQVRSCSLHHLIKLAIGICSKRAVPVAEESQGICCAPIDFRVCLICKLKNERQAFELLELTCPSGYLIQSNSRGCFESASNTTKDELNFRVVVFDRWRRRT